MGLDIFAPKAPPVLGVDISSSSIKMVELVKDKGHIALARYAIEPLAEQIISDGAVKNTDALSAALQACHKRLGSKIKGVATALPASMVVMKTLRVDKALSEAEIEEQITSDLSNHLPYSIDEASIDFRILPAEVDADDVSVVVAAALRSNVDERAAAIEAAGLRPLIVDSDLLALIDVVDHFMSSVSMERIDRNILVAEIGSLVTHFTFLRNSEVAYSREHAFGGSQLTHEIQERLSVTADEARRIKSGAKDGSDQAAVEDMQRSFNASAAQEARRAVALFTTSTNYSAIDAVLFWGGSVNVPGLEETVSEALGVPARLLNPFEGMAIASGIDEKKLSRECASFVVACGLAMRRFDK